MAISYSPTSYFAQNVDSVAYFHTIGKSVLHYVFHTEMDFSFLVLQPPWQKG